MGDEEVNATIFGTPVAVKGIAAIVVVVLALALGVLIYLIVKVNSSEHIQQSDQQLREHETMVDALKSIERTNAHIGKLVDEQNYMLLSDDKDRKEMKDKLRRPESLSRKLRGESD